MEIKGIYEVQMEPKQETPVYSYVEVFLSIIIIFITPMCWPAAQMIFSEL